MMGTSVFTNTSFTGGQFLFKVSTGAMITDLWRSVLQVSSGEADIYLANYAVHILAQLC